MRQPTPASREIAAEVGAAYLDARSLVCDAAVVAAYECLQRETDQLFRALTAGRWSDSVRIAFTRCREPYTSDRELISAVRSSRVLEMTTAAVDRAPVHPVMGCEFGGPFDRFRAVHDLIGHARTGLGFGLDDELEVWRIQDGLHTGLARLALATELLAINSARWYGGEAPEQKAMLLERELVARARTGIDPPTGRDRVPG